MKNLKQVLEEAITFPEDFDMLTGELEINIDHGYVVVKRRDRPNYGNSELRYMYHPNEVCEGKGICSYCGMTLFD